MVTDSLVHKKFVHDTLHRGISKIYATQESVVRSNYQIRSGRLLTSLSKHSSNTSTSGESLTIFVRILPYLRFLDMAYRLSPSLTGIIIFHRFSVCFEGFRFAKYLIISRSVF